MKKISITIIMCLIVTSLTGCDKEVEMPSILFEYTYSDDYYFDDYYEYDEQGNREGNYKVFIIDSLGNVYYTDDEKYICHYKETFDMYEKGELEAECQLVKTLDFSEVQEKYEMVPGIVRDDDYEWIYDEGTAYLDVLIPEESWHTYYYDSNGDLRSLELFWHTQAADSSPTNNDSRVPVLMDWMTEIIQECGFVPEAWHVRNKEDS